MNSLHYKILIAIIFLAGWVIFRAHKHSADYQKIDSASLESANGYVNVFLNLCNELEITLSQWDSYQPDKSAQEAKKGNSLILADPLVPIGKVISQPNDPLSLKKIGSDTLNNWYAIFKYGNQFYTVAAGDNLLGRNIVKITEDKVYLSSQMTHFLYHIDGKKLIKRKN